MDMASSEHPRRSLHLDHRPLRLEPVDEIPGDATVRHVDQLDTETLEAFYDVLEAGRPDPSVSTDLEDGEIVVFTDYFRVSRA